MQTHMEESQMKTSGKRGNCEAFLDNSNDGALPDGLSRDIENLVSAKYSCYMCILYQVHHCAIYNLPLSFGLHFLCLIHVFTLVVASACYVTAFGQVWCTSRTESADE